MLSISISMVSLFYHNENKFVVKTINSANVETTCRTSTPIKLSKLREDQIDLFNQSRYPTYITHACQVLLQCKAGCINFIYGPYKNRKNWKYKELSMGRILGWISWFNWFLQLYFKYNIQLSSVIYEIFTVSTDNFIHTTNS